MQSLKIDHNAEKLLASAAERARVEKPRIKFTDNPREYLVQSKSNPGTWYTVSMTVDQGEKHATCTCPARKPCKHIASVLPVHVYRRREAAQAAPATDTEFEQAYAELFG